MRRWKSADGACSRPLGGVDAKPFPVLSVGDISVLDLDQQPAGDPGLDDLARLRLGLIWHELADYPPNSALGCPRLGGIATLVGQACIDLGEDAVQQIV